MNEDLMIKVDNVSMRFNLGIEKNNSIKQIVVDSFSPAKRRERRERKKKNEFSGPRQMLIKKGVIDASKRGEVSVRLPRFREFVDRQLLYDGDVGYP